MVNKSVTIKDIARQLGISKSTVSRALGGRSDVHPETKKKIMDLAHSLEYQPNALAINLKQQRTNTIGVIVPETINSFFARALGGIQTRADLAGVNVMICQSNESYITEKKNIQSLMANRVDGLIVSISKETDRSQHFRSLFDKGVPLVFFDRICDDIEASRVVTDNYEIVCEGTEHLISQGCKRIAFIAGPQHLFNTRNRLQGYMDTLQKHNLPVNDYYILHSHFQSEKVEEYTRYLINLPHRPDAIFAINDYAAIEMMHVIRKAGLRIPEDIAVLGFNNENVGRFVEPSLSTIDQPAHEMGSVAAEILINHVHHTELPWENKVVKSKLIIRQSTLLKGSL
jgi:DNA-binding LacI/PurR family transcriptional regulator